ncbi:MAG TPA: carbohydrate-binding protein [Streptosporangiaceae bacterium]|nr:carbohydrate-binding protein [Streptosporangiaceae bacterium]
MRHYLRSRLAKPWKGRVVCVAVATAFAPAAVFLATATAAPAANATTVPPPPSGWTTTYSNSFSGAAGSGVDSSWTYDQGTQYNGSGCTGNWGTGEVERETNSTANVAEDGGGHLNITPVNSGGSWTSGRIETVADNFAAPAGGEMEVSASIKQPSPASGLGYWPAFWMLGAGFRSSGAGTSGTMTCSTWPSVGEVDIMEDVNALSELAGTLHCGVDPGGPCNETTGLGSGLRACSGCQSGYNTYSVIINRTNTSNESITWSLNGTAYFTATESQVGAATWQAAVDHGFFLILDVAIGGGFPNGVCGCSSPSASTSSGASMGVGYVAVYTTTGGGGGGNTVTVTNPGNQTGTVGTAASLQVHASDSASGQTLTYSATGLPAGLSINSSTGLISGTPTTAGTSNVTVKATDTTGASGSAAFSWTIGSSGGGGGKSCTTTATSSISADCFSASQGTITVNAAAGDSNPSGVDGNEAAQLGNGDYLEYTGINFGSGSSQFDARVASGAAGGVSGLVEVVLDNPGNAPVGSFAVANTGGWTSWRTIPANITKVTGTHNVYLEFASGAGGNPPYVSLHYFSFPTS